MTDDPGADDQRDALNACGCFAAICVACLAPLVVWLLWVVYNLAPFLWPRRR